MYRFKRLAGFCLAACGWAGLTAVVAIVIGLTPVPALVVSVVWISLGAY